LLRHVNHALDGAGPSVVLRPGVPWPDWSRVADPAAREALEASLAATGWLEKWKGLGEGEDQLWQEILRGFARTGRPQEAADLGNSLGLDAAAAAALLIRLRQRDMVVLDDSGASVTAAYPFCAWRTGHRVSVAGGEPVHSLCAIDALGMGAVLGEDAAIESACRLCGEPVRIATGARGHGLASVTPGAILVWAGVRYAGNCSATSSCTLKAFFCSGHHLAAWRERAPSANRGFELSLPAALQYALAIFRPLLMSA
jgi:hypothetical protein